MRTLKGSLRTQWIWKGVLSVIYDQMSLTESGRNIHVEVSVVGCSSDGESSGGGEWGQV